MSDNFKVNEMINAFFADGHCHYWEHNISNMYYLVYFVFVNILI